MNNPQQPREYDAVLGGNSPSMEGAAVLGGIEGVKLRLQNPDSKVRIAALHQALNYGEQGLNLIIESLKDESLEVQDAAYFLLKDRIKIKVKEALRTSKQLQLISVLEIDYTKLRDLLDAEQWEEADEETKRVMLMAGKRQDKGWLNQNDIENFPLEDLCIIDELWGQYSNGRFGFSVQKKIYQSLVIRGFRPESIWYSFAEKVEWRKGNIWLKDMKKLGGWSPAYYFDTRVEGHFPAFGSWGIFYSDSFFQSDIDKRVVTILLSRRDF